MMGLAGLVADCLSTRGVNISSAAFLYPGTSKGGYGNDW